MNPKVDKWVRKAGSWCEKACPRTRSGWIMIALTAVVIVAGVVWLLRPRSEAVHYPIVAVEPVATQNVEIYGEFVGRSSSSRCGPAWRVISNGCSSAREAT